MKRYLQTLVRLFFHNRVKRYKALRNRGKAQPFFSNGEDWYEFGV